MAKGGDCRWAREGNGDQRPALPGHGYLGGFVDVEECGEVLGRAKWGSIYRGAKMGSRASTSSLEASGGDKGHP